MRKYALAPVTMVLMLQSGLANVNTQQRPYLFEKMIPGMAIQQDLSHEYLPLTTVASSQSVAIKNPFSTFKRQSAGVIGISKIPYQLPKHTRDLIQIYINGTDSTEIVQGSGMQITVYFSDGSSEADANMWLDVNDDATWEPDIDSDMGETNHLVDNDESDENPAAGIYQETLSGSEGISMIANIGVLLVAEDAGGSDAAFVYIQPMSTEYSIAGQVTPPQANLIILAMPVDPPSEEFWMTVTDSGGIYEINVPQPGYYFVAMIDFLEILGGSWISDTNYLVYIDDHLTGYDITLQEVVGAVTGELTDQDGLPISGVEIHGFDVESSIPFPAAFAETDTNGNYLLGLYAGNWIVSVNSDYLVPNYLIPPASATISISPGDTLIQDFQLYATDSGISGTVYLDGLVYDQSAGIRADSDLGSTHTNSASDGTYFLAVSSLADAQGGYSVSLEEHDLPEGIASQDHYEGIASGSGGIDFHLVTLTGGVSGYIFDAETLGSLPGADLHVVEADTDQHYPGSSDADGFFLIPLPAGTFDMIIFADCYYNQIIPAIVVADDFVELTVYQDPVHLAGTIYGYVYNADTGSPIEAVPISVTTGFNYSWYASESLTDSDGYYSFEVPNGTFYVQASLDGWAQLAITPLEVNDDQVQLDLTLAQLSGGIQGTVSDAVSGQPIPDAWVYADNGLQDWGSGMSSNADGSYAMALINGNYVVTAERDAYIPFESQEINVQDEIVPLDISLVPTDSLVFGDVNEDQTINVLDIVLIVAFILGNQTPTPVQTWVADLNGDGQINVLDIVNLVDIIING